MFLTSWATVSFLRKTLLCVGSYVYSYTVAPMKDDVSAVRISRVEGNITVNGEWLKFWKQKQKNVHVSRY